ncbi:MAG: hypothetical protein ACFCBW_17685, partial [Candidatus Competibacterales bacterium]
PPPPPPPRPPPRRPPPRLRSQDFQRLQASASLLWRIQDPVVCATHYDFAVKDRQRRDSHPELRRLEARLQAMALSVLQGVVQGHALTAVLKAQEDIARQATAGLLQLDDLTKAGLAIQGMAGLSLSPDADTAKALEAEVRERLLAQADEARGERQIEAERRDRRIQQETIATQAALQRANFDLEQQRIADQQALAAQRHQAALEQAQQALVLENEQLAIAKTRAEVARFRARADSAFTAATVAAMAELPADVARALGAPNQSPQTVFARAVEEWLNRQTPGTGTSPGSNAGGIGDERG